MCNDIVSVNYIYVVILALTKYMIILYVKFSLVYPLKWIILSAFTTGEIH